MIFGRSAVSIPASERRARGGVPRSRSAVLVIATVCVAATAIVWAFESVAPRRQIVDGDVSDWPDSRARLQAAATVDDLLVAVRLPQPAVLSDQRNLSLVITSAADPANPTLTWSFGEGRLTRTPGGETWTGAAADVSVVPPFRTAAFEWQLSRLEAPGASLSGSLRVTLVDAGPRESTVLAATSVTLPAVAGRPTPTRSPLHRPHDSVRIFSLNAESSSLMDPKRGDALARLITATAPDILVLQELYAPSAGEVASRLLALLPGAPWNVAKQGVDLVVATRHPRIESALLHTFPKHGSIASFDVWVRGATVPVQIVNAHLPCCRPQGVEEKRLQQIDAGIAHARDRRDRFPGVPVLLIGDLNLVGDDAILEHLERSDPAAGWRDLAPARPTRPTASTWRVFESRFPPSRLDYALVANAPSPDIRAFILDTRTLPSSWLAAHGLERADSDAASDHQAIILDLPKRSRLRDP